MRSRLTESNASNTPILRLDIKAAALVQSVKYVTGIYSSAGRNGKVLLVCGLLDLSSVSCPVPSSPARRRDNNNEAGEKDEPPWLMKGRDNAR